jgi:hypothetical protein
MHRTEVAEMSKMKEIMMKGMNRVMLDCDHATQLAVQSESEKLGCVKRMQLSMHLMGCKLCRAFVEQSKIISKQVNEMKNIEPDHYEVALTEEQRKGLKKVVEENQK